MTKETRELVIKLNAIEDRVRELSREKEIVTRFLERAGISLTGEAEP